MESITLGDHTPVALAAGDMLYTLHDIGEGYVRFWYKVDVAELAATEVDTGPAPEAPWQVLALPETEWWVKIRMPSGQVGWTKEAATFERMDACE